MIVNTNHFNQIFMYLFISQLSPPCSSSQNLPGLSSHIISKTPYCIYRLRTATQFLTPLIALRAGGSRGWEGVEPSVRSLKLLGHSFRGVLCPFTFHIIPIKKKEKEEHLHPHTITMELSLWANHPKAQLSLPS